TPAALAPEHEILSTLIAVPRPGTTSGTGHSVRGARTLDRDMDTTSTTDLVAAPRISYPADLPVSQRRGDIQPAVRDHAVVVIAGEPGSGQASQIAKVLREMGYGAQGRLIGHTQPRRIAARSVAGRIASELGEKLGEGTVGFQVRFTRETSRGARLKLMTDGILLAE